MRFRIIKAYTCVCFNGGYFRTRAGGSRVPAAPFRPGEAQRPPARSEDVGCQCSRRGSSVPIVLTGSRRQTWSYVGHLRPFQQMWGCCPGGQKKSSLRNRKTTKREGHRKVFPAGPPTPHSARCNSAENNASARELNFSCCLHVAGGSL